MPANRNGLLILGAAFLRSLGIGLAGVVLGIYLARAGFSATRIGLVIGAGLAGSALATSLTSLKADRAGRRVSLIALSLFSALGGIALMLTTRLPTLLPLAFLGMLNGLGTDRGAAFSLEQAILPQLSSAERRTWTLSRYNLVVDAGHALGALMGALPLALQHSFRVNWLASYEATFGLYAAFSLLSGLLYKFLSAEIELQGGSPREAGHYLRVSPYAKRIVTKLAALTGLDSLGGGFIADSLVAYWFFRRFGISEAGVAPVFFAAHLLNSVSYLVAAWLARRIGLLNTMVFTHLPSNLFLVAVPFAPSFPVAVGLLLARESLASMDVPARQSYLMAAVRPEERTFASGMTHLTRNFGWAAAPLVAGPVMQSLNLGAPLIFGGGLKLIYDLLLYGSFRGMKLPAE